MVNLNFIPESVQLAQQRVQHAKVWFMLLAVSGVLLSAPLLIGWVRRAEARQKQIENDKLQSLLAERRTQLRTLESEGAVAALQIERAKALRSKRAWSAIFAAIAEHMPPGCWLTSCASDPAEPVGGKRASAPPKQTEQDGAPDETVTIEAPRKLIITGYATTAAEPYQFVSDLKDTNIFTEVALTTSRREPALDGSYFQFELLCEW